MGAGNEGTGATSDLATSTGTRGDGHAPVDELDGPLLPFRRRPSSCLPALRTVRGLPP